MCIKQLIIILMSRATSANWRCSHIYLLVWIISLLGFVATAVAEPNCFSNQIRGWAGYKDLNKEELKLVKSRLDVICNNIQDRKDLRAAAELYGQASVLKLGLCDDHSPVPEFTQLSVGNDPIQLASRIREAITLFCANTRYDDFRSLLDEYKKFSSKREDMNEDIICFDAAHYGEGEGWRGRLSIVLGLTELPSVAEVREKAKVICQDLKLKKITRKQAVELLKVEQMFAAQQLEKDITNLIGDGLSAPFKLLAWLVAIGSGLVGLILGIQKLTD